jgi:hypothetical protein
MAERNWGTKFDGLFAHECDVCEEVTNDVARYTWSHRHSGESVLAFFYCYECAVQCVPGSPTGRSAVDAHKAMLLPTG